MNLDYRRIHNVNRRLRAALDQPAERILLLSRARQYVLDLLHQQP